MDIRLAQLFPSRFTLMQAGSEVWGATLEFPRGSLIQVSAPSARGKSTFISMVYGLERAYTGSLTLGPEELQNCTPHRWALLRQKELSILFQDLRLFDHLSGLENILVKARLSGTTGEAEIARMAGLLQIAGALGKPVAQLSWGEKQRIALLRALVQPFSWLLLDEPFSHLDHANTAACAQLILQACRERGAGLVVTSLDRDALFPYDKVVAL